MRAALKSYLRNFYEVLALPAWSETEIQRRVRAVNEPAVRGRPRRTRSCRRPAAQRQLGSGRRLGLRDRNAGDDRRRAALRC